MRILIIDGHPDTSPKHFCHALADAYSEGARTGKHEVRTVRVSELDMPEVRSFAEWSQGELPDALYESQRLWEWAEHIVIIYPLWLGDVPAYLKAFLEQILRPGFAMDEHMHGLLSGRSARIIVTMGMPAFVYRWYFFSHSLSNLRRNILQFVGIRPVRETLIGSVEKADHEAWLNRVHRLGLRGR